MARRTSRPVLPRPDLDVLEPSSLRPVPGDLVDGLDLHDLDLGGSDLRGTRFLNCRVREVSADGIDLRRSRFTDCALAEWRGSEMNLAEATWREVEFSGLRVGAFAGSGLVLERVLLEDARVDYLDLRGSTVTDLTLRGCDLRDVDATGCTWTRVRFEDCRLGGLDTTGATWRSVDLRGAEFAAGAQIAGVAGLRGAVVDDAQLLLLAPLLAAELGLRVEP
ncbi:pentapeptide repeat-containing protein [Kineococcus gynurae]|uniref:Pentapeptide repeat-containing protein n=1 Tax=Kineococcus gynurae TaxID=452979 RepID=A0ABV5LUY2_9ACTN